MSRPYFRALNCPAASFALLADFSMMLLGGELEGKERLSASRRCPQPSLPGLGGALAATTTWATRTTCIRCCAGPWRKPRQALEAALEDLLNNFPSRFFGCALKVLVLPPGRRHKGPGDELDAEIAGNPRPSGRRPRRCRRSAGAFLPKDPAGPGRCPRPRLRRAYAKAPR
ncbi:acyl-CoA dehydrogenase domain-containing protein [Pseudomonas aeruginosa]